MVFQGTRMDCKFFCWYDEANDHQHQVNDHQRLERMITDLLKENDLLKKELRVVKQELQLAMREIQLLRATEEMRAKFDDINLTISIRSQNL
jgi:hypothetical protein